MREGWYVLNLSFCSNVDFYSRLGVRGMQPKK